MEGGVGTTIGGAAGSVIPGVGTAIGAAAGTIFDAVFGNINRGEWQGNIFVPGDLSSRQNQTAAWLQQRGLTWADVDQNTISSLLYTQSGWQASVEQYLEKIKKQKNINQYNNQSNNQDPTISSIANTIPPVSKASLNNLFIILIIGFAAFYLFKKA